MMTKSQLIEHLAQLGYLKTPAVVAAFERVDRRDFVLPEYADQAYENHPLPIGFGQTISQPLTVAFMLELLAPQRGDRVLEIGAGSGWQTALLSDIVSEEKARGHGRVIAIERISELKEMATANVAKYNFIAKGIAEIVLGDGSKGYAPRAPFDRIIAAATAGAIPVAWKQQLVVGGRLVAPVKNSIYVCDKISSSDFNIKEYHGFSFVPLVTDAGGSGR